MSDWGHGAEVVSHSTMPEQHSRIHENPWRLCGFAEQTDISAYQAATLNTRFIYRCKVVTSKAVYNRSQIMEDTVRSPAGTRQSQTRPMHVMVWHRGSDRSRIWSEVHTNNNYRWLYCVECPQYSIRLEALGLWWHTAATWIWKYKPLSGIETAFWDRDDILWNQVAKSRVYPFPKVKL